MKSTGPVVVSGICWGLYYPDLPSYVEIIIYDMWAIQKNHEDKSIT